MDNKKKTGFALLSADEVRTLARRGAAASIAGGKSHRWTTEEAIIAGRKGAVNGVKFTSETARAAALKGVAKRRAEQDGIKTRVEEVVLTAVDE